MPFSVNHPEARQLADTLAERLGKSVDEAVVAALRESLERTETHAKTARKPGELWEIGKECAALPDYDVRSPEEILGYGEHGAPA